MTTLYYSERYNSYFVISDGLKYSTSDKLVNAFRTRKAAMPITDKVFRILTRDRQILFQHETSDIEEAFHLCQQLNPELFI